MADQNFRVKRGLEVGVGKTVLYADPGGNIGVGITQPSTKLEVAGDLSLYNGSTYSTVIQSITPTANRTISFPDQTGTIGLVAGSTGNVQYNGGGILSGTSNFNVQPVWDSGSTNYTGLKLNVTDPVSGNASYLSPSNLLDLQVDGTAQLRVNNFGQIYRSTPPSTSGIRLKTNTGVADYGISDNNSHVNIVYNSTGALSVTSNLVGIGGSRRIGFSTNQSWDTVDLVFGRDAANTLAQRNGGTDLDPVSQTYRLYNFSVDSTSDYERTSITDDSTGLVINQEYDGTGALRTNLLDIQDNGTSKVVVTGSGNVGVATTNPQYKLHVVGDFAATTKSFVIPHPTKPGLTLRHGNLEGPENAVYVRGKTTESIIPLPDYWTGLVDEETITVNLTPKNRKLHSVVGISSNTVEVECVDGEIDCYFMILGERKDVAKLVTEY